MPDFSHATIDEVRQYWDRRPCNIRHSTQPVGTRAYFDEVEARKYFVELHIPRFAEFERWRGKKVLEIGCGIGTDTVNFARQRVEVYGLQERVRFFNGSAEELTSFVPRQTYDLIYSFGVIHHTPHPERVLDQVRQYAAAGSTLKVMVYHRYSWKVLWIVLGYGRGQFWRTAELVARHSEAQTGCPVTYTYSRREARRLVESRGFRVSDLFVDHIFPYRIADYVQYRYLKAWPWSWLPQPFFRWLEKRFGWHLCLTAEAC